MMTRQQRAKQFQPFDAMKGLQEALRDREERHCREERREISEEAQEANSAVLARLRRGSVVHIEYYRAFHDVEKTAAVSAVSIPFRWLLLGEEKVFFDDIYAVEIVDY